MNLPCLFAVYRYRLFIIWQLTGLKKKYESFGLPLLVMIAALVLYINSHVMITEVYLLLCHYYLYFEIRLYEVNIIQFPWVKGRPVWMHNSYIYLVSFPYIVIFYFFSLSFFSFGVNQRLCNFYVWYHCLCSSFYIENCWAFFSVRLLWITLVYEDTSM